jgi:hypothetical protein
MACVGASTPIPSLQAAGGGVAIQATSVIGGRRQCGDTIPNSALWPNIARQKDAPADADAYLGEAWFGCLTGRDYLFRQDMLYRAG